MVARLFAVFFNKYVWSFEWLTTSPLRINVTEFYLPLIMSFTIICVYSVNMKNGGGTVFISAVRLKVSKSFAIMTLSSTIHRWGKSAAINENFSTTVVARKPLSLQS